MVMNKTLTSLAVISVLSGCASHKDYNENAINAVDVYNKEDYRVLSEFKNRRPVTFEVYDNRIAVMNGLMDSTIHELVANLLRLYPNLEEIVMGDVSGSLDLEATMHAGRLIKDACIEVSVSGTIQSGGILLLMAGCEKDIAFSGEVGIHTWKYADYDVNGMIIGGFEANDFPVTSEEHTPYLEYYAEMGIDEDLYWFTNSIPFNDMYFLSYSELVEYNIL